MSHSDGGHISEQPDSNLPDPSSQVTGPIYAEITDEESKDPTYECACKVCEFNLLFWPMIIVMISIYAASYNYS